jgi:uncharacterized protein
LVRAVDQSAFAPFNGYVTCRNEGFIKFKVEVDIDDAYAIIDEIVLKGSASTPHVQLAIEDSYKSLLNQLNEALQEASQG